MDGMALAAMRVLFVENQDSFTWNVVDALPVPRAQVRILPGLDASSVLHHLSHADVLVVGPGPKDPIRCGLTQVVEAAANRRLPTLGVCLGHQALGLAFGARLVRVPPMHGKQSVVQFRPSRHFGALTGPQQVMRYHSLALAEVPAPLHVIAQTEDGVVMAMEHRELPMAGLQFHPDSFATPRGVEMIESFFRALP